MNKHILLIMKWLNNKSSVTQEELGLNAESAYVAYADESADVAGAAYAAAITAANANAAAITAANVYAATAAYAAYTRAAELVDIYFDRSGEDKEDYTHKLTH